jgi:uncharacterized protein YdeI (BOF family)
MPRLLSLPVMAALIAFPLASAAYAQTPVPIEDAKRGTMVTVAGTVERITDEDEFILTDQSDSIRVYVGPNWVPAQVGDTVTVHGFVDDDLLRRELYARTLTMADGTTFTFDRRYD